MLRKDQISLFGRSEKLMLRQYADVEDRERLEIQLEVHIVHPNQKDDE